MSNADVNDSFSRASNEKKGVFEITIIERDGQPLFFYEGQENNYAFNLWHSWYASDGKIVTAEGEETSVSIGTIGTHAPIHSWYFWPSNSKRFGSGNKEEILESKIFQKGDRILIPGKTCGNQAFFENQIKYNYEAFPGFGSKKFIGFIEPKPQENSVPDALDVYRL